MVKYKWVALSNTTIGVFMATINGTITLISLPAIFRGIQLSPFQAGSFVYLLWILMGFNIVTATLLVTFGRLSDIFGRVKLFNLVFLYYSSLLEFPVAPERAKKANRHTNEKYIPPVINGKYSAKDQADE